MKPNDNPSENPNENPFWQWTYNDNFMKRIEIRMNNMKEKETIDFQFKASQGPRKM